MGHNLTINLKTYQVECARWAGSCFGHAVLENKTKRNHHFIEEAVELVQSHGIPKEEVLRIVDYVFDRPLGEPTQEVGGTMTTLATMCEVYGYDLGEAMSIELQRCLDNFWAIRSKYSQKPDFTREYL